MALAVTGISPAGARILTIGLAPDSSPVERHAAVELQTFLGHLLGCEVILNGTTPDSQVLLFTSGNLPADLRPALVPPNSPEAFVLKNVGYRGRVRTVICGRDAVGTLYGAYELIEAVMAQIQGNPNVDLVSFLIAAAGAMWI